MATKEFEVVIVGGGPAGLSAALMLGRCLRRVLVCDDGRYRNAYSHAMHGFLSRDGIDPAELRKIGREQLKRYETVEIQDVHVVDIIRHNHQFILTIGDGQTVVTKKLLLATGLRDQWPTMEGAKEIYGTSIFHCPYCDGWELRQQPLAVFGNGDKGGGALALELILWSPDIVLCTDGPSELGKECLELLKQNSISIRQERIIRLESHEGILQTIQFEKGEPLERRAIFFSSKSPQRSDLPARLGCEFDENGGVKVGKYESTNIPGLFVAGDATRDVLQAIVAAGEGVEVAFAINTSLIKKEVEAGPA